MVEGEAPGSCADSGRDDSVMVAVLELIQRWRVRSSISNDGGG